MMYASNAVSVINAGEALDNLVNSVVTRGTGVKVVLPSLAIEFIVDKSFQRQVVTSSETLYIPA